jgi:F420 biosynthesis protein FbiB-like protein
VNTFTLERAAAGQAAIDHDALAQAKRLIEHRRSVRRYEALVIDDGVIRDLLHCASRAPSAHNRQPWRFAVLRAAESKATLAQAMGERLRRDRIADGDRAEIVEADVARSFERVTCAPVVILVASSLRDMDLYPDDRRRMAEAAMAMQSTAMAVQNLLLAASAAGLGACWMCAPLFCPQTAALALGLPVDWQPQGLVTLGIPQAPARERLRKPLDEVVRFEVRP